MICTIFEMNAEINRIKTVLNIEGRSPADTLVLTSKECTVRYPGSTVWQDGEGCFHYLLVDEARGTVCERVNSRDPYDVLYKVAEGYVFPMAMDYELAHRVANRDTRRLLFK